MTALTHNWTWVVVLVVGCTCGKRRMGTWWEGRRLSVWLVVALLLMVGCMKPMNREHQYTKSARDAGGGGRAPCEQGANKVLRAGRCLCGCPPVRLRLV